MTQQAGIVRHDNGLGVATVRVTPWTPLSVYAAEYYLPDGFSTAFGQISFDPRWEVRGSLRSAFSTRTSAAWAPSFSAISSPGIPADGLG